MDRTIYIKKFDELSSKELYEILKTRSEVFVVEQTCLYLDIDGKDYDSIHVFLMDEDNRILAYLRMFYKDDSHDVIQIGRVLTTKRNEGFGLSIMNASMEYIKANTDAKEVFLEAQSYATGFYEKFGFQIKSEEFLDDGIPHKNMICKLH